MTTTQSLSDELEVLKSIYSEDFSALPLEVGFTKSICLLLYPEEEQNSKNYYVSLQIHLPKSYPEQIPKLAIEEYKGVKEEEVRMMLEKLFDLTLKMSGQNMLHELSFACKEVLSEFYKKYLHSLNTQEDLYEKFQVNQKLRQEKEKRAKEEKKKQEKEDAVKFDRLMGMNSAEENKLREKWFMIRSEEQPDEEENDELAPEISEYSAGCELISFRDLFTIHLLKIISSLSSKLLLIDENDFRTMLYNELKAMDILNDDALELLKRRANTIFSKLYLEKFRSHSKKIKKKQQSNVIIEDMLYKPIYTGSDNQFFKLIDTTKRPPTPETGGSSNQKGYTESMEMVEEKDGVDSLLDEEEQGDDRKEDGSPAIPALMERVSSIEDSGMLTRIPSKFSTSQISGSHHHRHSRYQEDFEELEFLGRGGFSEVVKVRNKLDGRFYAVKKIIIRQGQRLARIMREVQTLSRLHHQNIIRYYQAWLEEVHDTENINFTMDDFEDEGDDQPESDSMSFNLSGFSSFSGSYNDHPEKLDLNFLQFSSEKKILRLYIQTEYCQQVLRTSLADAHLDANMIWRLFRQTLEALAYIHSQKVIHRDLKPENIFIGIGGDIKIGDFGLATKNQKLQTNENKTINHIFNFKKAQISEKELIELDKTMNVGTYFYRAYEMDSKESTAYDEKVDVFSLGIILFEMWHPFTSRYERYKILYDLKNKKKLPAKFEEAHPRQSRLIKLMLERNPDKRPTVADILNNDLLPPKMEDDYMNDVIKSVSNPNTIFYKKLIEALFQIKGHEGFYESLSSQSLWETTLNWNQEIFVNMIAQRMATHFRSIGALPISSPLVHQIEPPRVSASSGSGAEGYGLYENDPRVFYLNKIGFLEYLRINPRKEFEHFIQSLNTKMLAPNFFKGFELVDVYYGNNLEGIQKQTILNYDSLMLVQDYNSINTAETIFLNIVSLDKQFTDFQTGGSQVQGNLLKLKVTHMAIIKLFFHSLKITNKGKIVQILKIMYEVFQNDLSLTACKTKIQQVLPITEKSFERMLTFFTLHGSMDQCKKSFESLIPDKEKLLQVLTKIEKLFADIKDLFNTYKDVMKERQKTTSQFPDFEIDMSLLDPELLFKKDIYYEIRYKDPKLNRLELLSFGGVFKVQLNKAEIVQKNDAYLESHGKPRVVTEKKKTKTKKEVCGFSIYVEKITRIIYGNTLKLLQTEKSNKTASNVFFKCEAMICSLGGDPGNIKTKLSMVCWQLKIPNLLYITEDPNISLEEQLECAEKNDINLIIIIKEKIFATKNKVSLRWKKEKNKIEKEYTIEELIGYLKSYKSGG